MKQIKFFILTALVAFALMGCTDDLFIVGQSPLNIDEDGMIETQIGVSVSEFSLNIEGGTRADGDEDHEEPSADTEIMSDFEKQVDNIWVFQYDTYGEMLIYPRYYTTEEGNGKDGVWNVLLKPVASTIYVVTNVNSASWATTSYNNFATIDGLLAQTLPFPEHIEDLTEGRHIPMKGCIDDVRPGSEDITVPVEHMYAKVKMRVILDSHLTEEDAVQVNYITYSNIPWYCRVGTLYDKTSASKNSSYPTDDWVSHAFHDANNTNDPNNDGLANPYDYVIYVPENLQGENTNTASDKDSKATGDNTPARASMITVDVRYIDDDGARQETTFSVCPGGNNYNNYNIRRNQVYRVTLNVGYPTEVIRQPSANCLFGYAGETIAFFPYYRVEEGGGYKFSDYLSPNAESGTGKKIGGLKIIWQTENCIGDNSNYDLVYLVSTATEEGTHNGFEEIYVKTQKEGNALIAAYEDADCKGDIIWSWHIWVRDPKYSDPTNLANAMVYYTYNWDDTGIYSWEYYTDRGETPVRVPGYQIMSCNIGALRDEPVYANNTFFGDHVSNSSDHRQIFQTGDDIPLTYGMMYQWGRKDPFPPLYTTEGARGNNTNGTNTGFYVHDYNDAHTEQHYDNAMKPVHKTSYDNSGPTYSGADHTNDGNYLFHSHIAESGEGMDYAIKNPTVFLCGTNVIAYCLDRNFAISKADSTDYVRSLNCYKYKGGWSYENEFDNNEWGGTDPEKSSKSLTLGFQDQMGYDIALYDDYGTEKSIFDPCPYGWRVSSGDLWLGFTKNGVNALYDYKTQNVHNADGSNTSAPDDPEYGTLDNINYNPEKSCFLGLNLYLGSQWRSGQTSWFPTQGYLLPDGCGYRVGGCGNYVNANADADPTSAYDRVYITHIHDGIPYFRVFEHQLNYVMKSAANPLRCVRDTK